MVFQWVFSRFLLFFFLLIYYFLLASGLFVKWLFYWFLAVWVVVSKRNIILKQRDRDGRSEPPMVSAWDFSWPSALLWRHRYFLGENHPIERKT